MDWLKTILGDAYTDDIDKAVSKKIGEDFVSRGDFNTANTAKKSLETQLGEAKKTIGEFKNMDIDGIKRAAEDWKAKFEAAEQTAAKQLEDLQFDTALHTALAAAKARNPKAVAALLNREAMKFAGGSIVGLNEQLEAVKKDNGFLFEAEKAGGAGFGNKTPATETDGNSNTTMNSLIRGTRGE